MLKKEKIKVAEALTREVTDATAIYFVDFTGVGAVDTTQLRRQLRGQGVSMRVVKNRLARRAFTDAGLGGDFAGLLRGPTAVVFTKDDPVAPARLLRETSRRLSSLKVKGVYLDGTVHPAAAFEAIATLPGKAELQGQLVGALEGLVAELVFSLEGIIVELVQVVSAAEEKLSSASVAN